MACGGSYLKLLSATPDLALASVTDTTPYTILFGPDKCGGDQYLRFIFRFKSPVTEEYSEVHARRIKEPHKIFRDKKTHLLTLVLKAELNEFAMYVDEEEVMAGGLGADDRFQPALSPPAKIADPEDFKPADWVDAEFIVGGLIERIRFQCHSAEPLRYHRMIPRMSSPRIGWTPRPSWTRMPPNLRIGTKTWTANGRPLTSRIPSLKECEFGQSLCRS